MPDGTVPLLLALIGLVLMSGFFSSTETAYSCSSRIKLRAMATAGNKRAEKVLNLAEDNFDGLISSVLIGNNIVNITAATIATIFFVKIFENSTVDASVIATIVTTVAVLIFGEITPKFIAKVKPEKVAMLYYPLVIFFYYLFFPLNKIFSGWKWLISKLFRVKNEEVVTEEEIMTVVEEAEEDGTINKEETKLIRSVIEFDDVEVGDILVPRVNMVAIEQSTPMEKIVKIFEREGFSRIPVYSQSIDTIIGTIHQKDFYSCYLAGNKNIDSIIQPAFFTTEHIKISNLLKQLQSKKVHIAVVLDEYGGTLGIVTLEDILEELVGEIYDEHDEEISYIKKLKDNLYLIDGKAPVEDVFECLDKDFNEEDFGASTISGWVIEYLGEMPVANKEFSYNGINFKVLKATVKRILQLQITIDLPKEEPQ
ncbi:MAG: HlyC/CorC family transporter [Clostridia bacterium]|nr:HlyC/CorC family transporter [Clostridia bacterium]